jgi:hypothetical protein
MRLYEFTDPNKYLLPETGPARLRTIEEALNDRVSDDVKCKSTRKSNLRERRPSHSPDGFNRQ